MEQIWQFSLSSKMPICAAVCCCCYAVQCVAAVTAKCIFFFGFPEKAFSLFRPGPTIILCRYWQQTFNFQKKLFFWNTKDAFYHRIFSIHCAHELMKVKQAASAVLWPPWQVAAVRHTIGELNRRRKVLCWVRVWNWNIVDYCVIINLNF